ncbi:anti-sigma factor family protein [Thermomonospora cellulosilytica]|uniref:Anti-sigma factor RsiW n=1 Tax=Thermomonospora cellulosilytica TaxID=1411118 RepID=A0A7W3MXR6_9ACTN|nr:zf-HC2 domain-containing protein [Thermomonospora cellulosilytica]MBA9003864.1 anti-sigma factor RsiW [Thermomonospora cellulosilytica]
MSCLGERLTALVDGELDHEERDRALAHLAGCDRCREEADTLRRIKDRLRALAAPPADPAGAPDLPDDDFLRRLMALGAPPDAGAAPPPGDGPGPYALPPLRPSPVPSRAVMPRPRDTRPAGRVDRRGAAAVAVRRRIPRRYLAAGAAAVVLGLGSASYLAGAAPGEGQPPVIPAFDRLEVEHSLTNGVLPMTETSPAPAAP